MTTLYLTLAAIGGVLLIAQLAFGVFGFDADATGDAAAGDGLQLFSVRALAAAAAAFGLTGLGLSAAGLPQLLVLPGALLTGIAGAVAVAMAQRAMLSMERDHTTSPEMAIGHIGTVHVAVPAAGGGLGKVVLELQGHFTELAARTPEPDPLASGTAVLVMNVTDDGTLEVVAASSILTEPSA